MPATAKSYIFSIIAVSAALTAIFLLSNWEFPDTIQFGIMLLLGSVASAMKVRLPTFHGNISITFVFFLIGIAGMSLAETLILGFLVTLLQCVGKPKTKPLVIQVLFNIAAIELSIITAHEIPRLWSLPLNGTPALVLSASSFFIANSGLIALVIAFVEQRNAQHIWRDCYLWTFPYYLMGAGLAGAITTSSGQGWKTLLFLPLMYLAYRYYRLCVFSKSFD